METKKIHTSFWAAKNMVLIGMFAAIMAVISQLSIPMPTGVPITIQVMGVALIGAILGWKKGFFAILVYILAGAVGMPVFAGFKGGVQCLVGMTGGYIIGWLIMVICCGIRPFPEKKGINLISSIALALIGLMVVELVGAFQWSLLTSEMNLEAIIAYSLVAFVPKDVVITVIGVLLGKQIRRLLARGGFLE